MPMSSEEVVPFRDARAQRISRVLAEQPPVSLRDQLLKLKRRKWVILGTVLLVTLLTIYLVERMTPLYTATTTVMIQPKQQQTLTDLEAVVSGLPADLEAIQGEMAVIQSRGLAEKVIDRLALDRLPQFNPEVAATIEKPFDPIGAVTGAIGNLMRSIGSLLGPHEGASAVSANPDQTLRTQIVNNFLYGLQALPQGRSRVIQVSYTTTAPDLAAQIANTVAELYILEQLEAKFDATERATRWLNERLAELRARTEASERAVEQYRAQAGLLQGETTTLATQELSRLNAELILARSAASEAEARLRAAEGARGATNANSLPMTVLQNPLIQNLQSQQIQLTRELADLSETFGERHPQIINKKAELAELGSRLREEVGKIVSGLRNEVTIARQREEMLRGELDQLKQAAGGRGGSVVELRSLEEDAAANRLLLNTLLTRTNETALQRDLLEADARIISPASVPQAPSAPNKTTLIALALLLSTGLGVVLALAVEHMDQGFRSTEQVGHVTGLPSLGMVPVIPRRQRRGIPPQDYFLRKPRSAMGEAMSSAVASLFLTGGDRRPRIVMVTSALPNEGKSTVSVNMARAVGHSGMRTLLIDADLRRPSLDKLLGTKLQPGLVEYLQDKATFEEIVQRDPKSNVDFIGAGGHVANPLHFLAADKTRAFIQGLSKYYDFVVIDSSPVMVVSDPRLLSRYVDETVFVVRWARTRREHALHAMKQIIEAGGSIGGTLLTMVNTRRHADYSFADSGQYHLGPRYYEN